jgi:3-deoxy-D-manno-octulosonate 8-phosphate phosphatase (KDO 8-P phosphatase)
MKIELLSNLKTIIFDVDGVLTDGSVTLDANGDKLNSFNVRDGQLINFMQSNGYIFGAISARESKSLKTRPKELNIDFYRFGVHDKFSNFQKFLNIYQLKASDVAYIGDDVIDIEVFRSVGFSFAPFDANSHVLKIVNHVTKAKGGRGVLREIIEYIVNSIPKLNSAFISKFKIK